MRFLLDQNQSPQLIELLARHGHDAIHVRDIALSRAGDTAILARAVTDDRILISADTDFGDLLAHTNASRPSVILLRRQDGRRAADIAALLAANLDHIADDLEHGAIVVIDDHRIRVRSLPFDQG